MPIPYRGLMSLILLVATTNANANHECLKNATNDELLNEIAARMNFGPPPAPAPARIILKPACHYSTYSENRDLIVRSTNLSTGVETTTQRLTMSSSDCTKVTQVLNQRFQDVPAPLLFAVCTYSAYSENRDLVRLHVNQSGEIKVLSRSTFSNSVCASEAESINNQP